jgi:hypothetical protein
VRFEFFALRFEFAARESLYFPPGKAGNILRGALGVIFRRIACIPQCQDTKTCDIRNSCPYAKIFEPTMPQRAKCDGPSPSGLSDWPRPFVFRARHLDGRRMAVGETFCFDVHIFSLDREVIAYFILTFAALAREGLGPRRGKADLLRVRTIPSGTEPGETIYEVALQPIAADFAPASIDLTPRAGAPSRIRVDFLSPTELKHEHKIASRPEFPILFGRIRDRISTLRSLYGPGPLEIDFPASGARAAQVRMIGCQMRRHESARRSTRTGESHSIGGFVGTAEYEGDLAEFLPYLEAARWTGVGRQVVWGKGEIAVMQDRLSG